MSVTYFKKRRIGPETQIEDIISNRVCDVFGNRKVKHWIGGSIRIGAGEPDLVVVSYEPDVFILNDLPPIAEHLLAHIRVFGRCNINGILTSIKSPKSSVLDAIEKLIASNVLHVENEEVFLASSWLNVLPLITTIEVKVSDWKRAVQQAARNRIFAHQSFVAFPSQLAHKVSNEEIFVQLGIGILAVEDDALSIVYPGALVEPCVWSYYYRLANILAKNDNENNKCRCIKSQLIKQEHSIPSMSLLAH